MPSLEVERSELLEALKTISKLNRRGSKAEAVLSFADVCLNIDLPGTRAGVAASGTWPGEARVPVSFLMMLFQEPPKADPITISVRGSRLFVVRSSTACDWEEGSGAESQPPPLLDLPLDPTPRQLLRLAYLYTPVEIERGGLTEVVEVVVKLRDACIEEAAAVLEEYGFTSAELSALVHAKMSAMPKT